MPMLESLNQFLIKNIWILIVLSIWELIWKAIAMWKASKNNHKMWFSIILIINTEGILQILYIVFTKKNKKKSK